MNISTYSFADSSMELKYGKNSYTLIGSGLDTIVVARANDLTQHDVAADGSVMASKIVTKNGTVQLSVQQTSAAHKLLTKWAQDLMLAKTSDWASTSGTIKASSGEVYTLTGVSPQKIPDANLQQSGQKVSWTLMVAEITTKA